MSMRTNKKTSASLSSQNPLLVVSAIAMIHVQVVVAQVDFCTFVIMHRSNAGLPRIPPPFLSVLSIAVNHTDPPSCEKTFVIIQALCIVERLDGQITGTGNPFLGVAAVAARCIKALWAEPICLMF